MSAASGRTDIGGVPGLVLVYSLGAVAGPVAVGPLMTAFGPRTLLLYFAAVFTLFGLFALYRLPKRAPVPSEAKSSFVPMTRTSQAALEMHPEVEVERRLGE